MRQGIWYGNKTKLQLAHWTNKLHVLLNKQSEWIKKVTPDRKEIQTKEKLVKMCLRPLFTRSKQKKKMV